MSMALDSLNVLKRNAAAAASMLRALANERRLMILCLLIAGKELAVGDLSNQLKLSQSATSQHLAKMRREGLIANRRDSQTIYYRIADKSVKRLITTLKAIYC